MKQKVNKKSDDSRKRGQPTRINKLQEITKTLCDEEIGIKWIILESQEGSRIDKEI